MRFESCYVADSRPAEPATVKLRPVVKGASARTSEVAMLLHLGGRVVLIMLSFCGMLTMLTSRLPAQARTDSIVGRSARGLHYVVSGNMRGEPLVLIHAFHTDHREWDEVTPILGKTRKIIRFDLRGHGHSARADSAFYAHEDLLGLLQELGVARADVAGVSAGSNAGLELALVKPEMVRRLVLISSGLPDIRVNVSREWLRPIFEAVRAGDANRAAELWWESQMMAGTRARGTAGDRYRQVISDNAAIWTQSAAAQRQLSPSLSERIRDLRVPTLIIVGSADNTGSRPQTDSIVARQPSIERLVLAGGHMLSTELPADVAAAIERFLSKP